MISKLIDTVIYTPPERTQGWLSLFIGVVCAVTVAGMLLHRDFQVPMFPELVFVLILNVGAAAVSFGRAAKQTRL